MTGGAGVAGAVRAVGGRVLASLPLVDGVSAVVPAALLGRLAGAPQVAAVTADREGRFVNYAWDETTTASTFARTMQAVPSWTRGNYGKGVGVAVLDTGVSPLPDLDGRLVHGPDLSGEAVGALNDRGDTDPSNDDVPGWSSRGPTAAGLVKPDLVAPGRTVVALRSPGSTIEINHPKALVSPGYIRGLRLVRCSPT